MIPNVSKLTLSVNTTGQANSTQEASGSSTFAEMLVSKSQSAVKSKQDFGAESQDTEYASADLASEIEDAVNSVLTEGEFSADESEAILSRLNELVSEALDNTDDLDYHAALIYIADVLAAGFSIAPAVQQAAGEDAVRAVFASAAALNLDNLSEDSGGTMNAMVGENQTESGDAFGSLIKGRQNQDGEITAEHIVQTAQSEMTEEITPVDQAVQTEQVKTNEQTVQTADIEHHNVPVSEALTPTADFENSVDAESVVSFEPNENLQAYDVRSNSADFIASAQQVSTENPQASATPDIIVQSVNAQALQQIESSQTFKQSISEQASTETAYHEISAQIPAGDSSAEIEMPVMTVNETGETQQQINSVQVSQLPQENPQIAQAYSSADTAKSVEQANVRQTENAEIPNIIQTTQTARQNPAMNARVEAQAESLFEQTVNIVRERMGLEPILQDETLDEYTVMRETGRYLEFKVAQKPDELEQMAGSLNPASENTTNESAASENTVMAMPHIFESHTAAVEFQQLFESADTPVPVQISNEIITKLTNLDNGGTEFEMILNPEALGKITVKLTTDDSGTLSLEILAERPETAALLKTRAENLAISLREGGVNLQSYEINTEQREQPFYEDGREQHNRGNNEQAEQPGEDEEEQSDLQFSEFLRSII